MKTNQCTDCSCTIDYRSQRCKKCANTGKSNPGYKGGKYKCIDCGKTLCNRKSIRCRPCMGKARNGVDNPNWGGGYPYCTDCGTELKYRSSIRCPHCAQVGDRNTMYGRCGELHPHHLPNITRKYPPTFNQQLKDKVRVRDNFICQRCGVPELECNTRLDIHHIDYNKSNSKPINLISLCHSCHSKTRGDRDTWQTYFTLNPAGERND